MKKAIFILGIVLIITSFAYTIKCQDIIVKINNIEEDNTALNVNYTIDGNSETESESESQVVEAAQYDIGEKVRIILMDSNYSSIYHANIEIGKNQKFTLYYGQDCKKEKEINKGITISKDSKYFNSGNEIRICPKSGKIKIKSIKRNNKINSYEGEMYLYKTSKGIVVVNELDLEKYVAAVVSSELNESYPQEALKAQAVCARTYIMKRKDNKKYKKYKAYADDSTSYQVYNIVKPTEKIIQAANETKGEVITYKDNLINAYFFSTSCGYTTDYKIWGQKKQNYLQTRHIQNNAQIQNIDSNMFDDFIKQNDGTDLESSYPFYRWNLKMSAEHIKYVANNYFGYDIGDIEKIEINSRGAGGIVQNITIYGEKKQVSVSNQSNIRKILNPYGIQIELNDGDCRENMSMLPSAFFAIENVYKNDKWWGIKIYGGGFGHGAGMSQNGCKEFAELGYGYQDIIKFFYNETAITRLSE